MKTILRVLLIGLSLCGPVFARGPKDRLTTPVATDQGNSIQVYALNVGSGTTVLGSTTPVAIDRSGTSYSTAALAQPNQDVRQYTVQNLSNIWRLQISSFPINGGYNLTVEPSSSTFYVSASTAPGGGIFTLQADTTFYMRYENGAPTTTVRVIRQFNQ